MQAHVLTRLSIALAAVLIAAGAQAQAPAASASATRAEAAVQRDVNQQKRIESGLQSGQLSTKEAGKLERGEAKIDKMEAAAMKDGKVSAKEGAKIQSAENKESAAIAAAKHNEVTGNPNSASSKRMQADVQRNVNQQQRIENGMQSGALTNREAGKLERGQARVARSEANAAADGHVGAREQARVQRKEGHQSKRIRREKHDEQTKS